MAIVVRAIGKPVRGVGAESYDQESGNERDCQQSNSPP
jgi:hypothetical protein